MNREGFKIFQDILTTLTVDSEQLCTLVKQNIKEEELHLKKKKKKLKLTTGFLFPLGSAGIKLL